MALSICGVVPGVYVPMQQAAAWTPLALSSLELWLDAQALSCLFVDWAETTPATNGSLVGRWKDQSGKGRDLGAEADQDSFKGSLVTSAINSKPAYWTQPNKLIKTPSPYINFSAISKMELWVVIKKLNTAFGTHVFGGFRGNNQAGNPTITLQVVSTTAGWVCAAGGNTKKIVTSLNTNPHLFRAQVDFTQATAANEIRVWLDGVEGTTTAGSTNNTGGLGSNMFQIGEASSSAESAYIGEYLAFSDVLADADVTRLTSYLQTKWGL